MACFAEIPWGFVQQAGKNGGTAQSYQKKARQDGRIHWQEVEKNAQKDQPLPQIYQLPVSGSGGQEAPHKPTQRNADQIDGNQPGSFFQLVLSDEHQITRSPQPVGSLDSTVKKEDQQHLPKAGNGQ